MNFRERLYRAATTVELSLPDWTYPFFDPAILRIKTVASILGNFRVQIKVLSGLTDQGPLRIAYLGSFRHTGYFAGLIFKKKPAIQAKGYILLPRLPKVISDLRKDHDFIFIELPYLFLLRLSGINGFTTTPWVHQILDLTMNKDYVLRAIRREDVKRFINKINRYKISVKISKDARDLEMFYHELYKPFISTRHKMASLADFDRIRFYFAKGWLFEVIFNNKPIYAALCCRKGSLYKSLLIGQKIHLDASLEKGIGTIAYYLQIMHALEQGYSKLDFGLSRPLLNNGVFCFKKKWGSSISCGTLNQGLWVGVGNNSVAAREFLSRNPFAWLDNKGQWHGLFVLSSQDKCSQDYLATIKKKYAVPGFKSVYVISPEGFDEHVQQPIIGGPIPAIGNAVQLIL